MNEHIVDKLVAHDLVIDLYRQLREARREAGEAQQRIAELEAGQVDQPAVEQDSPNDWPEPTRDG